MRISRTGVVLVAALALLAWAAPAQAAARREHGHRTLHAFLLVGAPDSLVDLKAHAGSLGVVYPTYFECDTASGAVTGADVPAITTYAASRQIVVEPRFNCQDGATVHRILTEPGLRARTLTQLEAIARDPLYGGVCVDLENDGAADREALSSFVATLAGWLHAHHRKLAVVVDGVSGENTAISTGFYDDRALSAAADTVFVLAWGTHWAGSEPGPIAPLPYVAAVAHYLASLPHASRFVLGAPMYGLDWAGTGGPGDEATAYQFSGVLSLLHTVGAAPVRDPASGELTFTYAAPDGVTHTVWYMDARSVLDILDIARANGLAGGLWRLGREDQALWRSAVVDG
jgi:spore germination protein YaaH